MNILDNLIVQTVDDLLPKKITATIYKVCNFFDLRNKEISEVGIKLTIIYFVFVLVIIFFLDAKRPTELSGYGDFLAGFFSPIAFGWLVIGYLMQNKELKNSVEQTNEAQRLARDQLEFQRKCKEREELSIYNNSQPILDVKSLILEDEVDDGFFANFKAEIKNYGSTIYDLCIYDCEINKENEDLFVPTSSPIGKLVENETAEVYFSYRLTTSDFGSESVIRIKLPLTFLDSNRNRQHTYIQITTLELIADNEFSAHIGKTFKEYAYK
ncbi:hypothetical protein DFP75_105217 [Marinomonas alcarazii]|uniref:Uncharacterized protein n=1 Tax=Marinomonas alcarazii TaxID=491949 RepID=A0A318UX85_9GAMM|nr:hypothetical protein [Marinomonas alcarazii]PYF81126.1 hypothetical protein DFP75_105217 [Marinomonas alcarazii]